MDREMAIELLKKLRGRGSMRDQNQAKEIIMALLREIGYGDVVVEYELALERS